MRTAALAVAVLSSACATVSGVDGDAEQIDRAMRSGTYTPVVEPAVAAPVMALVIADPVSSHSHGVASAQVADPIVMPARPFSGARAEESPAFDGMPDLRATMARRAAEPAEPAEPAELVSSLEALRLRFNPAYSNRAESRGGSAPFRVGTPVGGTSGLPLEPSPSQVNLGTVHIGHVSGLGAAHSRETTIRDWRIVPAR